MPTQSFAFSAVTSQQFCRRLWLYLLLDLSCIIDKIVNAWHLQRYRESTSGRRDGFRVNLLFRFEKNIWKECEQDNILNLRSWFITSVPWWNTAMSIWRLNSCKTQAWNDNSNTLILDTYNWPIKVLVKQHKLSW